jgi:hypothetical protein
MVTMKRNTFFILFLSVFVICSLLHEGAQKTFIRSGKLAFGDIVAHIDCNFIREGKLAFGDILFNIDGSATTVQKGALAAAALRLAGRL